MVIFDTENGRNPKAAADFIKALSDEVINNIADGCVVTITVGNVQLKAYDHAALIQGLQDAVQYYQSELEG
jgi:hypothetical protein